MTPLATNFIDAREEIALHRLQLAKKAEDGGVGALHDWDVNRCSTGIEWKGPPAGVVCLQSIPSGHESNRLMFLNRDHERGWKPAHNTRTTELGMLRHAIPQRIEIVPDRKGGVDAEATPDFLRRSESRVPHFNASHAEEIHPGQYRRRPERTDEQQEYPDGRNPASPTRATGLWSRRFLVDDHAELPSRCSSSMPVRVMSPAPSVRMTSPDCAMLAMASDSESR